MSSAADLARRASTSLTRLFTRDDDPDCYNAAGGDMCAKPNLGTNVTPVVIGTIAGVLAVVIIIVLTHFHLRRQRMDLKEWSGKNTQELDDYGMAEARAPAKPAGTYQASAQASAGQERRPAPARKNSQDSLRSLEMSLRGQKPADMV